MVHQPRTASAERVIVLHCSDWFTYRRPRSAASRSKALRNNVSSMPRQHRLDLAHVAQHVIQRGNDRRPCFFAEGDYARYLDELREIALREGCAVHAYVLMTNHVHLLMTPTEAGQIARVMQALGRRYVRFINDRYHRTGTLWEGRYKACLVDSETYLLTCYRYIELNPVRAAMVAEAGDYPWSSYGRNAMGRADRLVHLHASYLALARTPPIDAAPIANWSCRRSPLTSWRRSVYTFSVSTRWVQTGSGLPSSSSWRDAPVRRGSDAPRSLTCTGCLSTRKRQPAPGFRGFRAGFDPETAQHHARKDATHAPENPRHP